MIFRFRCIFIIGLVFAFPSQYSLSHLNETIDRKVQFFDGEIDNNYFLSEEKKRIDSVGLEETEKVHIVTEEEEDVDFFKVFHEVFFDGVKPYIYKHYPLNNVSEECTRHLVTYLKALEEWEPWAVMMFDATGKLADGFIGGSVTEFGSLADCLDIRVPQQFKGQFCTVGIEYPLVKPIQTKTITGQEYVEAYGRPPEWLRYVMDEKVIQSRHGFYMGTCIPSSCTDREIHAIFHSLTKPWNGRVTVSNCQVDEPREWDNPTKIAISVLAVLFSMIAIGTATDLSDRNKQIEKVVQKKSVKRELMKAFSIYTNAKKLFEIKKDEIGAVNLIKVLLCLWVVFGHNIIYPLAWREVRFQRIQNAFMLSDPRNAILDNSFLVVDVFFILGGVLLALGEFRELEKTGGKLNIPFIIFKKYMRFTPAHIVLVAMVYVGSILNSGPVWNDTWNLETEKCNRYGWKNLLYIQNFRGNEEMCQIQTWYVAVTMQHLFVVLPLLVLTYRHLKLGLTIGVLLIIGCIVRDFLESMRIEFLFFTFYSFRLTEMAHIFVHYIYFLPYHHISPTLFGMVVGVLLYKIKDTKIRKTFETYQRRITIAAIVSFILSEYSPYFPTKDFRITAFYNSTRTTFFSFGISWFIYAAIMSGTSEKKESSRDEGLKQTNQKSVPIFSSPKTKLNEPKRSSRRLMTLASLAPLSRITYSTYMFHPLILILRDAVLEEKMYFGLIQFFVEMVLLNILSFGIGIVGYLIVEKPFDRAFDLWLKRDEFNADNNPVKTADKEKEL